MAALVSAPVYAWDRPAGLSPHVSGRSVWAWWHYFQRAFTDLPKGSDYYDTQYLNPSGQGSSDWGSYIKDRPLSRPTIGGTGPAYQEEWRRVDMQHDCEQAWHAGLDGFQINCINHFTNTQDGAVLPNILEGATRAAAVGCPIKIMLMSDGITGSQTSAAAKGAYFAQFKNHPHVLKTSDGKLVLGSFAPELSAGGDPAHWQQVIAAIGSPVYFIPSFLNPGLCMSPSWVAITQGCGIWGGNVFSTQAQMVAIGRQVMDGGREWMPTAFPADYRPNFNTGAVHQYRESSGSRLYRQAWADAIGAHQYNPAKSNKVSIATWNDYSEHNHCGISEPGVGTQSFFRDMTCYFSIRYKTGSPPVILRDQLGLCHRIERTDTWPATGSGQPSATPNASGAAADAATNNIEAIAYLSSAGSLEADRGDGVIGPVVSGSGLQVTTVPMAVNMTPKARVRRSSSQAAALTSTFPVRGSSKSQDLQYKGSTSVAAGGIPPVEPVKPPATPPPVAGGWSPDVLGARILLFGPNASWSGSSLAALPNAGVDWQGIATVAGPPTRGADLKGLATVRADAAAEMVTYQLKDIPAGGLWFFWYGKALTAASDQAFIGHKWPTAAGGVAAYLCSSGSAKSTTMGNGYGDNAPRFRTASNAVRDTEPHCLFSQIGMLNELYVNGREVAVTASLIGEAPAYPAGAWVCFHSGAGNEVINAETLVLMVGVTPAPSPADRQRLEGWACWMGGSQSSLDPEHPYAKAPPMLDEVPPGGPIEVDVSGQAEHEGRVFEFEGTLEVREVE